MIQEDRKQHEKRWRSTEYILPGWIFQYTQSMNQDRKKYTEINQTYYTEHADAFIERTADTEFQSMRDRFLQYIGIEPAGDIIVDPAGTSPEGMDPGESVLLNKEHSTPSPAKVDNAYADPSAYVAAATVATADVMANGVENQRAAKVGKGILLDLGCGSGRDAIAFHKAGWQVEAMDFTPAFVERVRQAGIPAACMDFRDLDARDAFDGIWACASLLHLEPQDLDVVMDRIWIALKEHGIFYCSMKKGTFLGLREGRYFHDILPEQMEDLLVKHGFEILEIFETCDARKDREDLIWVNAIARKRL